MKYIYDIESYPNYFRFSAVSEDGQEWHRFECSSRRNDIAALIAYLTQLRKKKYSLVGFNNLGYDYPVVHSLWEVREKALKCRTGLPIADKAHRTTKEIFASDNSFEHVIHNPVVKQVDLYKIHHFDNKARSTGLKALMFNMRRETLQDLPFPPGTVLSEEQMDVVGEYNDHDVLATLDFYRASKPMIEFREALSEKYGMDFTNFNDTKIGKEYFIMRLEEEGIKCFDGSSPRQSKRDSIALGDVLFNYYDFKRPEFLAVVDWLKHKTITETKGVLTEIPEEDLRDVAKYATMRTIRKKVDKEAKPSRELGWIEEVPLKAKKKGEVQYSYWDHWKVADNLNVVVDGFRFDFGTGGIHGSLENTVVESDDVFAIVDADVASMYPNLAISNNVYPEHLSEEFCSIYKDVYEQRKSYAKGTPENAMLKLALNGVYGDSNNQYSPFYDPKYTMSITINGQLSLCLLAEKLLNIFGLTIIQVNTDGITVKIPRTQMPEYNKVCAAWQQQVGLELEFVEYSKMMIRDVNNYIAVDVKGKVKRKGAYQYEGLEWHKDSSNLVARKAAEAHMLHGVDIKEFIAGHQDIYDFALRVKVGKDSRLVLNTYGVQEVQQNTCRYIVTTEGGTLTKVMPPLQGKTEERIMNIEDGWKVSICNDMRPLKHPVNFDYYVKEAEKLVVKGNNP